MEQEDFLPVAIKYNRCIGRVVDAVQGKRIFESGIPPPGHELPQNTMQIGKFKAFFAVPRIAMLSARYEYQFCPEILQELFSKWWQQPYKWRPGGSEIMYPVRGTDYQGTAHT